jgi:molecular chaperone DnaK
MDTIFGIDLGTTNSEIAYMKNGKPVVIEIENGKKYLPSVVGIDQKGNIITGFTARNQYIAFPENTVKSIKRKMGSSEIIHMGKTSYSPSQISAEILKTLKTAAWKETGIPVKKVVITVPAYFTDLQRKDTIEAGERAGLDVVRIINEPTAAALAYGCRNAQREKILVYDLGGGTFDISLIDVEDGVIEVIGTSGDSQLGGDDFDLAIQHILLSHLPPVEKDVKLLSRSAHIAEDIKIRLSTESSLEIKEEFMTTSRGKPVHLKTGISRNDFEACIEEKLNKTFHLIEKVVKEAKLKNKDVDKVLLVGGSTYIPRIFHVLKETYGFDIHREIDPTYCVAIGAAIQGAIIAGKDIETILVDVNAHSLGIRCLDIKPFGTIDHDHYSILIHRNTPIPASMTKTYHTTVKNQKEVHIEAFQGEDPAASNNTFIGSFILDKLAKKLPAGSEIDVTFEYTTNGVVKITACERKSGRKEKLSVDTHRLIRVNSESGEKETGDTIEEKDQRMRIERLLKTAHKKMKQADDPVMKKSLASVIAGLEDALSHDTTLAEKLADELASLIVRT